MVTIACILFEDFETLDLFGPVEVLGSFKSQFSIRYFSQNGGIITSVQGAPILTEPFKEFPTSEFILFIPGGIGTRPLIKNNEYCSWLLVKAKSAKKVLTVCTGSALLAQTGFLDKRKATSNKMVFNWVLESFPKVFWIRESRWVVDGDIYTSSGVSAGIDMSIQFIADYISLEKAVEIANVIEHEWNDNSDHDPFAELYI